MKDKINWKREIESMLCDIGRDPKPFIAGALSILIGAAIGYLFIALWN